MHENVLDEAAGICLSAGLLATRSDPRTLIGGRFL